jgi:recombination protein RecA
MATRDQQDKDKQQDKERAERSKALELTLSQIEKQFGKGSIMRLGQDTKFDIPAIPTGSIALDLALGIGGLPRGRVVEIFGPESSGKTTLSLSVLVEAQRAGGVAAFIDAEHALDPTYAKTLGINLDQLLVSQPDTGEQALEIAETLVRSNAVDVIVIDSVAALVPRAEIEGEMGDAFVGLQARLMSQALRKLTAAISKSKSCCVFINQLREKIGVMFGNPETTPGGRALKFYSSVRIDLRRIESIKIGDRAVGNRVRAKIVKNKVAPPFRQAEFDILFDEGISRAGSVLDMGETVGVVQRQGSWISSGDTKLGQGREAARLFLKENPKLMKQLEEQIRRKGAAEASAKTKADEREPAGAASD